MMQTARLLRWSVNSISFWKRPEAIPTRQIEVSILSYNNTFYPPKESLLGQIRKIENNGQPQYAQNKYARKILNKYSKWVQKSLGLIDVQSIWLLIWNLINYFAMGAILVQFLVILLINALIVETNIVNFNPASSYLISAIYIIDMLLVRYRIPIQINGNFIKQPQKLLIRYLKRLFLPDLLSIILIIIKVRIDWRWQYLRILIFLKYLTGTQIDDQISYKLISFRSAFVVYSFFKFVIGLIFWTTFYAYINFFIQGTEYYQKGLLWLTASPSLDFFNLYTAFQRLIWFQYALFFVLETMRGCGYGIVTPRNPSQFLFANIAMLTTMAMFAYFTKRIIDLFVEYSIQKQELLSKTTLNLRILKENYNISQSATMKYLEQAIRKQKKRQKVIESLAQNSFSQCLKHKFMYHFRIHFIFASQILSQISDCEGQTFKMELCQVIYRKKSFKGQYLYKSGVIAEELLYFTDQGRILEQNKQLEFSKRSSNWSFAGIRQFFIDKRPILDVVSSSTLQLFFIKKQEFWQVIKKYRLVFEKYCEEIDKIRLNRCNTYKLALICCLCKHYHLIEQCLPYAIFKENILMINSNEKEKEGECPRVIFKRKQTISQKIRLVSLQIACKDSFYASIGYFIDHNV